MEYTVKCYSNTGFNSINIPESLSFLEENYESVEYPALDILQNEGLQSVRIQASWDEVRYIDYVVIGGECYSATPSMTSSDVCQLDLVEDPLTSVGGPSSLVFLDGVTERHTVADDTLFAYTQDDEYMAPNEPLVLVVGDMEFPGTTTSHVPVEATIDMVKLGEEFTIDDTGTASFTGTGVTFTDSVSASDESVTVPYLPELGARTQYIIAESDLTGDQVTILSPNTRLYETISQTSTDSEGTETTTTYPKINKALALVRALGVESSLISQIAYPDDFVRCQVGTDGQYSFVRGCNKRVELPATFNFTYASGYNNNRLFCGQYNKYGLITAKGSRGEYNPEQIAETSLAPHLRCIADPRPDGKPYFRYQNYEGSDSTTSLENFFISCVDGLPWYNVPLTYTGAKDSYMDTVNFTNNAAIAGAGRFHQGLSDFAGYLNFMSGLQTSEHKKGEGVNPAGFTGMYNAAGTNLGVFASMIPIVAGFIGQANNISYNKNSYLLQRQKELSEFAFNQSVVAPEVVFPFSADTIRDFIGNGVIPYRYEYSKNDLQRIDKLLTMYGYKDSVPVTNDLFYNRENFDYVRATGVSVIGGEVTTGTGDSAVTEQVKLPMWKKQMIADQLSAGVRVWHVKPNVSAYLSNPIKGETDE